MNEQLQNETKPLSCLGEIGLNSVCSASQGAAGLHKMPTAVGYVCR
jgi:hypothetical protein